MVPGNGSSGFAVGAFAMGAGNPLWHQPLAMYPMQHGQALTTLLVCEKTQTVIVVGVYQFTNGTKVPVVYKFEVATGKPVTVRGCMCDTWSGGQVLIVLCVAGSGVPLPAIGTATV